MRASREVDWTAEPCVPTRSTGYRVTRDARPQPFSVSGSRFLEPTVPRSLRTGLILSCPFSSSEFLRRSSRPLLSERPVLPGVSSLFAALLQGVHLARGLSGPRYVPSSGFLNLSTVCSTLQRCGLIASHSHVQGFPFRGFSRSTAALIHHQAVPPCRFRPRTDRLAGCHTRAARLRGLAPWTDAFRRVGD
jgi:hypothetical protein